MDSTLDLDTLIHLYAYGYKDLPENSIYAHASLDSWAAEDVKEFLEKEKGVAYESGADDASEWARKETADEIYELTRKVEDYEDQLMNFTQKRNVALAKILDELKRDEKFDIRDGESWAHQDGFNEALNEIINLLNNTQ